MCSLLDRRAALPAVLFAAAFAGSASAAEPGHYGYGRAPTAKEIAGWDIDARPDGAGLPPGSGSVARGAEVYDAQCAGCHGTFGEGAGRFPKLAGGKAAARVSSATYGRQLLAVRYRFFRLYQSSAAIYRTALAGI